jgi:hypothetical protein
MESTFKVLFYLKRDKRKANGLVPPVLPDNR